MYSVICSETNTVSITNNTSVTRLAVYFFWKLILFMGKMFYNLPDKPIYGLVCLLSYLDSVGSHL